MLNYIWPILILVAVVYGLLTGRGAAVSSAAITGAREGINLCILICGVMCFWCGVMEVGQRSGLVTTLGRFFMPVAGKLFPGIGKDSKALKYMSANIAANLLGLGNAATPMGIQATTEMAKNQNGRANRNICMFIVMNTASLQLIPTNLIALRQSMGSGAPFEIIPAIWLTSIVTLTSGIISVLIFEKFWREDATRKQRSSIGNTDSSRVHNDRRAIKKSSGI